MNPQAGAPRRLESGKAPVDLLADLLGTLTPPPELRLGPTIGEDACAIDVPGGVLVAATDPITFTTDEIGALSVIVNANDVAVTGARPRWFLAVILVPPQTTDVVLRDLFGDMRRALAGVGAYLVGGHTEVTPAVNRPIVVGQMLGLTETRAPVRSGGVAPGSVIVQIGPAPIEGAAVLAREAGGALGELDPATLREAREAFARPGISVVEPALLAAALGAVALHDPTEGGIAAGLHEMASASGVRIRIDRDSVLWFGPGIAVCRALGADPWSTLASGTLLAAFPPRAADVALPMMHDRGYPVAAIGIAESGSGVHDSDHRSIPWPERDEVARVLTDGVSP